MHRTARVEDLLRTAEKHTRAGRWSRAVFFYRKVLRLTHAGDFERELSHARLGDLHLGLGQATLAIPHLARAHDLSGGDPEYALMLGRAFSASGDPLAAAESLYQALESPFHATEALGALAESMAGSDRRAARRLARRAARLDKRYRGLARALADA